MALKMVGRHFLVPFAFIGAFASSAAKSAETVTYSYDALGRLVASTASGGPNSGVSTGATFDPAGNRTSYAISGGSALRGADHVAVEKKANPPTNSSARALAQ